MKKFHEFTNKEAKNIIVALSAELKTFSQDSELKNTLKEFADAKKGKETNLTTLEIIPVIINSLLVTNEDAFWRVLSAITQKTIDEVQEMNNAETVAVVTDFFSIEFYKKLLYSAIKSATKK